MHKVLHEKLNSIFLGLLALAHMHRLNLIAYHQQMTCNSLVGVSGVEDSMYSVDLSTLLPIVIKTGQRSDLSRALSLLPSVRFDNMVSFSNQQGDIRPAEICCASSK